MSSPFKSLIRLIARELAKALRDVMGEKPLDSYRVYPVDLATARTDKEMPWGGDFLLAQKIDGKLDIKLSRDTNDIIELDQVRRVGMPFNRLFLTNTAQAGKSAKLIVGTGMFESVIDFSMEGLQTTVENMGQDDTEVSTSSAAWDLLKSLTLTNMSETRNLEKIFYEKKCANGTEGAAIQIRVANKGDAETVEVSEAVTNTVYEFKGKTLSKSYEGGVEGIVIVNVYGKVAVSPIGASYNRGFVDYGDLATEVRML